MSYYLDVNFFRRVQEVIPDQMWSMFVDPTTKRTYWQLRNTVYCQAFWTAFMRQVVVPAFKSQNMIDQLYEFDATKTVLIDRSNLELVSLQGEFSRILYAAQQIKDDSPYLLTNWKMDNIFAVYLIVMAIVIIISLLMKKIINVYYV